jgi:hypothetical protein
MNDGHGAAVQVGTAYAFQGREFPVVIADLVEDGTGTSWVAQARRTGKQWARDGVRLFNVAVTRNAGKLYVVANLGTIQSATAGPLSDLGKLLRSPAVEVWDGADLLGRPLQPAFDPIWPDHGVGHAAPHILDDAAFFEHLRHDLERADQRVVLFSPFATMKRFDQLLPMLRPVLERGVKVTALTKTAKELLDPAVLDLMRREGIKVRERKGMHEKVVIIDDHVTYIGSLNVLSNTGKTGEIMMRFVGADTNSRISHWMRQAVR